MQIIIETCTNTTACIRSENSSQLNPVDRILGLLGDKTVLLPVLSKTKQPNLKNWQNTTLREMQDNNYLQHLQTGNIGVLLGKESDNLCAIDIDDDDSVEPFLELNPRLRSTTRTKGARGVQLWIRCNGEYPKVTKIENEEGHPCGEWRADGGQSVIHGIHPSGVEYRILVATSPILIAFSEITWPSDWQLPWVKSPYDRIVDEEGPPVLEAANGGITLNQMFFVTKYTQEHKCIYHGSEGEFYEYSQNTGLYSKISKETIKRRFLDELKNAAKVLGMPQLQILRKDSTVTSLLALLQSVVEQSRIFDEKPEAIHVANGMICFEEDKVLLKSFHPSFLSRNACPYQYVPTATCNRFLTELLQPALREEDINMLQKWAGSVLLGNNKAQRLMMLLGSAGGGKSTLMTVLEGVIGSQNVAQMRTEHLGERFELLSFVGKTLLTGKDVAAEFLRHKGASTIKSLVGGDLLEAEKKGFNNRVQIRGNFNIGITCNADLVIRLEGDVDAWRRRLLVLRYVAPPPKKRISGFDQELLKQEGAGILRWMVEGAIALIRDLRTHGDYVLTERQQDQIEALLDQSDSIKLFVRDCLERSEGTDVTKKELEQEYCEYCDTMGWSPLSTREISQQLNDKILKIHKVSCSHDIRRIGSQQRGFRGIRMKGGAQ